MKFMQAVEVTTKLSAIKRTVFYPGDHLENDVEHSYQLAIVCWTINQQYQLHLNEELLIKYALVHDLVEIYAGDLDPFIHSKEKLRNKKKNEEDALVKMKEQYKDLHPLFDAIEHYEKRSDDESILVYVLDKFLPDTNIYLSKDNYYQKNKISYGDWVQWFESKVSLKKIPEKLKPVVEDALREIETNYLHLFYQESSR